MDVVGAVSSFVAIGWTLGEDRTASYSELESLKTTHEELRTQLGILQAKDMPATISPNEPAYMGITRRVIEALAQDLQQLHQLASVGKSTPQNQRRILRHLRERASRAERMLRYAAGFLAQRALVYHGRTLLQEYNSTHETQTCAAVPGEAERAAIMDITSRHTRSMGLYIMAPAELHSGELHSGLRSWKVRQLIRQKKTLAYLHNSVYRPIDMDIYVLHELITRKIWMTVQYIVNKCGYLLPFMNPGALRLAHEAARRLLNCSLQPPDIEIYTLQRVLQLADGESELGPLTLHEAAYVGSVESAEQALQVNPHSLNSLDADGYTPLIFVCDQRSSNMDMFHFLMRHGADVHARGPDGWTALHEACRWGHTLLAQMLLDAGVDVNVEARGKRTPLYYALLWGELRPETSHETPKEDIVEYLLRHGADASALDDVGQNVFYAIMLSYTPSDVYERQVKALIEAGAGSVINNRDHRGRSTLESAMQLVLSSDPQFFRLTALLIRAGACPESTTDGWNILHFAAIHGDPEAYHMLREAKICGIDTRTPSPKLVTPALYVQGFRTKSKCEPKLFREVPAPLEDRDAFEALLRDVRDRQIETETARLKGIIAAIREGRLEAALEDLDAMVVAKEKAKIYWEAETIQAVVARLRESQLKPAIENLVRFIGDSRDRKASSPFSDSEMKVY